MLAKENRLNLARDFRRFKERGRSLETPYFRLTYLPAETPRFGFVVTNRIGKAVERNRARRLMREVVRSKLATLPPMEAVLIARGKIVTANYEDIESSFNQVLSKVSLPR